MKKEIIVIGVLVVLLFSSLAFLLGSGSANGNTMRISDGGVKGYTPHDVIRINGDSDFNSSHGVVSGSGTQDDPYIISGWDIDAHGLEMQFILVTPPCILWWRKIMCIMHPIIHGHILMELGLCFTM